MKIFIILLTAITFNVYAAPVNINKADAEQLSQSLNGIGLKKAMAIVKYRKENGAFKTLDDLTNVKGIGEKTVKKNKADIESKQNILNESEINKKILYSFEMIQRS